MKKVHVKISPASFTRKEMQVKTTLKYHFLFIGWVGIQKFWHLVLVRVRGNMLIRCCGRGVDRGTLCGDELATMGKNHKSTYSLSQQVYLGIHSIRWPCLPTRGRTQKVICLRHCLHQQMFADHPNAHQSGQGEQIIILPSEGILCSHRGECGCILCSYTE